MPARWTPVEHNVAVWCARQQGLSWGDLDQFQRAAWINRGREVIRIVDATRGER